MALRGVPTKAPANNAALEIDLEQIGQGRGADEPTLSLLRSEQDGERSHAAVVIAVDFRARGDRSSWDREQPPPRPSKSLR